MTQKNIALFTLDASQQFGMQVANKLDIRLGEHEEREFEDGEHKSRPLENVRGRDVFVVQSLYGDAQQTVNDKLVRLLFFLGALRDASAERVTAVIPYLCYARKDRKTKSRDPVTTRYIAGLFESVGVDRLVTLDVHNLAAFQNAFRCHTDHLEAKMLFVEHFTDKCGSDDVVVVSPDIGGVKRAELFRQALSHRLNRPVSSAFMEKQRSAGVVSGDAVIGEISGKIAIIIDDLIASGTTIARAVQACHVRGASRIYAAATHGVFTGEANEILDEPLLEQLAITNTIPPFRLSATLVHDKLFIVDSTALIAESIRRIHTGGSLVELLED